MDAPVFSFSVWITQSSALDRSFDSQGARATDLATMFVCGHCMVGAPGSRKLRATAPELSLANRDRGRRYLPLHTVERVFDSLTGAHRTLDKLRWRLPVASALEDPRNIQPMLSAGLPTSFTSR
jgi:hypothetical protein